MEVSEEKLIKMIRDEALKIVQNYNKTSAFTDRKLTDTPTDALSVVNRKYTNLNGTVANRPISSVATIGQKYFATDTNILMTYNTAGWYNGSASIVALNN